MQDEMASIWGEGGTPWAEPKGRGGELSGLPAFKPARGAVGGNGVSEGI